MRGENGAPKGQILITGGETHGSHGSQGYSESDGSQIIYDGNCKLCKQAVRFLKSGTGGTGTTFFPAESTDSESLLQLNNIPRGLTDKTVILIDNQKIYIKSSAIIKSLQKKGSWWKLAGLLRIIPAFIRDAIYDFIARNR
jgi:predicted DCC family thiol-disulfide oxidoreductase YuxK